MPNFVFIGFDHPPHSMALRDKFRPEHRDYVKSNDQMLRFAGAFYDDDGNQCGTLIIAEAENAEQVWNWFRSEPFFKNNVYKNTHVIEWRLALNQFDLAGWAQSYPGNLRQDSSSS